jgi:hypothetical protein
MCASFPLAISIARVEILNSYRLSFQLTLGVWGYLVHSTFFLIVWSWSNRRAFCFCLGFDDHLPLIYVYVYCFQDERALRLSHDQSHSVIKMQHSEWSRPEFHGTRREYLIKANRVTPTRFIDIKLATHFNFQYCTLNRRKMKLLLLLSAAFVIAAQVCVEYAPHFKLIKLGALPLWMCNWNVQI